MTRKKSYVWFLNSCHSRWMYEDNEVIESLRALDEIMADYVPTGDFDEDLFGQIVESITVVSKNALRFCLAGGLALTERI